MTYFNLRNIDSKFHDIKVNQNWKRSKRIRDLFIANSLVVSNYESFYEQTDWCFTIVFGNKCRFHDIYIITNALSKIGLSHIYLSSQYNTEIFVGEHSLFEGSKSECMHIEFILDMNPLLSLEEVLKLYENYPYKNDFGYSKKEIEEFDEEWREAAERFYDGSTYYDADNMGIPKEDSLEGAVFIIPMKHYAPEDIIPFGVNKGNTLKDIHHYMPKYIEWLIKYVQEFEIDVREFEVLPKPIAVEPELTVSKTRLQFREHVGFSVNAIKKYAETKPRNTKEIEFKFTIESIEILEFKRLGKYFAPKYNPGI